MFNFLIKTFIKDSDNINDPKVRTKYGTLSGITGIILNVILFIAKLGAGIITGAISITADAFNNLSDAGSSIITLLGFKIAAIPPDKNHPFGHGRVEYVTGLIVSMGIILVGVELFQSSVSKIFHPEEIVFEILPLIILLVSAGVKIWMYFFNKALGKKSESSAMLSTAADSLTDAFSTIIVSIGLIVTHFTHFAMLDGILGSLVALFILYTGIMSAKENLSPLLGEAPSEEMVDSIKEIVLSHDKIIGLHDLVIHNYGPGRIFVSLHAEVPSNCNILQMHDLIDNIENDIKTTFKCVATIHMDPVDIDDTFTADLKNKVIEKVKEIDKRLSIHDFRIVRGETHTNIIFDTVIPEKFEYTEQETEEFIEKAIKEINPKYFAVVNIEKSYT